MRPSPDPAPAPADAGPRGERSQTVFFRPFVEDDARRGCASCRHSIGWDSVHVFCQRAGRVSVYPCGHWEREAGCD